MAQSTLPHSTRRRAGFSPTRVLLVFCGVLLIPSPWNTWQPETEASGAATQVIERTRLDDGPPVRRQLSGGQTIEYVLTVPSGEYVRIVLQQQQLDVTMTVEVDGANILVDGANGSAGQESVSLLGRATDYLIKVNTRDKKPEPGSYEIVIAERRTASESDQENVAVQLLYLKAKLTRSDDSLTAKQQRAAQFDEARRRWHEINERAGEANALLNRGMEYHFLDNLQGALTSYEEALNIFRELGSPLDEAVALYNIGLAKLRLADTQGSLANFTAARDGFRNQDDQKRVGATLYQIGRVYYLEGELALAEDSFDEAVPIRHQFGDAVGEAFTLMALGRVYSNGFKNYDQGLDYYQRALSLLPAGSSRRARAQVFGDIGRVYFDRQTYPVAQDEYEKALREVADNDRTTKAELLMYSGMVHAALGHHDQALNSYQQALGLQTTADDSVGRGQTLKNMALSYSALNDEAAALKHLNDALEIWTRVMYRTAEADTRYEIARVQTKRGNFSEARKQIELAFPIIESLRTKIANQHLRTSYFASAQKFYELYIDVLMRQFKVTRDRSLEALALEFSERSRTRSMLDVLIELRAGIISGANPADLKKEAIVQRELTALSQRQMLNSLQPPKQKADIQRQLNNLLTEYRALETLIRKSSPRYAALTHSKPISIGGIQELLAPDQMLLEYALGDERSYVWAVTKNSIKSYELPARTRIEALAKRVNELLIEPRKNRVPLTGEALRLANKEYNDAAESLSKMLLGQIESLDSQRLLIVASGGLQYVHVAALPVPARDVGDTKPKSGKVPLLKYHEIETPPSMSVLAELKNEKRNANDSKVVKTLAVIADPVFNADDDRFNTVRSLGAPSNRGNGSSTSAAKTSDVVTRAFKDGRVPRLIFSRREAEAILSIVPPGEGDKIVDFDASLKFVTGPRRLSQYRYVHIATHGLIDYNSPELSALLLSLYDDQRQQQEGLLQMHEIYNLSIPVEIVVLSACGTGAGNDMKGEGLASLSRAFVYAGARRVVASLWEVGDASTAELMKSFYRKLLIDQERPAAALRAAQLEMWNKNPDDSPYDWAAFFTYGAPYFERMKTKTANVGPGVQGELRP